MSEELLYWQALNRAMDAELAADASVFTLGEDVGLYGGSYRVTEGLYAKYGEWRVRDTPISEGSFTGLGVGAALAGLRPVVEIMTINFMLLALDSIINAAAKIPFMSGGQFGMPLVVRVPGGVAHQLGAQHSQRLEYTLMNVPGLRIAVPSTPQDAYWQLRQAIVSDEPIILLEHELLYFSKGPVDVLAEATSNASCISATRRPRSDDRELFAARSSLAGSRSRTLQGRHRGGGHRSAQPETDRLGHVRNIAREDAPHVGGRRRLPFCGCRSGDRGDADRALLQLSRCAGATAGRARHFDPVQWGARGRNYSPGPRYRGRSTRVVSAHARKQRRNEVYAKPLNPPVLVKLLPE